MNREVLNHIRNSIARRRENVLELLGGLPPEKWDLISDGDGSPQYPMDGNPVVHELSEVLEHIDDGTFGRCVICNGEVEPERLDLDFSTCICLDHYTEAQRRELERDLEMAAQLQRQLFPCCVPSLDGIEIAAFVSPARIVSGDYYDFFHCRNNDQGIVIADVMGKGVPASILMANLQASLRILGSEHEHLHQLTQRINELFRNNLTLIRFITLFLVAINTEKKILRYCNAGHNPALIWNTSTKTVHRLKPTGPAIGLMKEAKYHSEDYSFHPGDVLVLYTDGITEAQNQEGSHFGEDRLAQYIEHHSNQSADLLVDGIWRSVQRFSTEGKRDDAALLIIRFG